jgi:phosphopantetheine--protein transferase-like protein
MIVVTAKVPVGVDLEPLRPFPNALSIARHYFTASETHLIARTHERTRAAHFLTVWTRKEAYLKATGLGLTMPLDRFSVGVQVPWIRDETGRKWRLVNLPCLRTHAAALCAPGRWRWRNRSLPRF